MSNSSGANLLGHYQLLSLIGQGERGFVYRAREVYSAQEVALKVLLPSVSRQVSTVQHFWREFLIVRALNHPNIIQQYEFGQANGVYFIATEYFARGSLARQLKRGRRMRLRSAVALIRQVAAALDAAHVHEVVHRDLKPANLLLGHAGRVVLTDFGVAQLGTARGASQVGHTPGTPLYMSPEQIQPGRVVGCPSDIYSLGVVTYQLLTGHLPFEREEPVAVLHAHVYEPPPPIRYWCPDLPLEVERTVSWALAKDPDERPPTAGYFARYLESASVEAGGRGVARPWFRWPLREGRSR